MMDLQSPFPPFIFLIIIIITTTFFFKFVKSKNAPQNLPPGPWKLPLIGSILHLAGSLPHRALKDLAKKHGPLMHLQLGEISAIVVSSPRMAMEFLKTHDLSFATRPEILATKIVAYNNSIVSFSPYGDYWREMRKICSLELLSTKKVRSFRSIREDEVWHLIETVRSSSSSGSPFNLSEGIFSLINAIVCRASFGARCKDQDALIDMIKEVVSLAGGFDVEDLFPSIKFLHFIGGVRPKLEKVHQKLDRLLSNIINKRLAKGTRDDTEEEDLLAVLLRLKESGGLQFPITSTTVKAILLDMFFAGSDTSSTTIDWAMSEMIKNPRVMEKAQAEVRKALKGKKIVRESDTQGLNYLKLVIKETLRLHPPLLLILPRECREQCEVGGYEIPLRTKVMINVWAIGRDPEYWKDAESFVPERFENSSIDMLGNNYQYIPFGAGRRTCPGFTFGLVNVELPLAQLLYHFNWKLPGGKKLEDLDMSESFGATVKRRENLYVIATPNTPIERS